MLDDDMAHGREKVPWNHSSCQRPIRVQFHLLCTPRTTHDTGVSISHPSSLSMPRKKQRTGPVVVVVDEREQNNNNNTKVYIKIETKTRISMPRHAGICRSRIESRAVVIRSGSLNENQEYIREASPVITTYIPPPSHQGGFLIKTIKAKRRFKKTSQAN